MRRCPECTVPLHPGVQVCLSCGAGVKFGPSVRRPWVPYAWVGGVVILLLLFSGIVSVLIG